MPIRTVQTFVPVPNAFVEQTPATLVSEFAFSFNMAGVGDVAYIKPGNAGQQTYAAAYAECEWLLYTRSVFSFSISNAGNEAASLIVSCSHNATGLLATPEDVMVFCIPYAAGAGLITYGTDIRVPSMFALFRLVTSAPGVASALIGNIIMRAL